MSDDGDLTALTAIDAAKRIAAGELSAAEYVGACLDCIDAIEDTVHAFAHLDRNEALRQAKALDELRRKGRPIGPLHGVPVAIKDVFDTADFRSEYGSPLLKGRQPMRDAAAVSRLRAAGAVIIGKTVTAELAYFHPGPTRNPRDVQRTPGGSSSGSAAAVAAGMVPLAIGTQTNGSTIRPASFCGVYGIKPSHGLISRARALMLSRTLDHVGIFARSLADAALILEVLAGYDGDDADTRAVAAPDFLETLAEDPPLPPQFAFVRTPKWGKADAETRAACEAFVARLGDSVATIELPEAFAEAWPDHRTVMAVEMAHNIGALVERGGEASSKSLRDILAEGRGIAAVRYLAARDNARRYVAGLSEIFKQYDAIITPAAPGVAPKGEATGNPVFSSLWTLTGLPALSLPLLSGEGGMPLGVQLIGEPGEDARLLRTANWLVGNLDE
jgi:Asp-tRNA(Asn)/Glu-tRNA(Gln) amidotransferase A subunit family amidase